MATYDIQVSTTSYPLVFLLVQSADHITALNSATPVVLISKVGGLFSAPHGAVSEVGIGWYKVAGNATDSNALGPLVLHATAGTSSDPTDMVYNVVAYNPQVSPLTANVTQWVGSAPASLVNALVQTQQSGNIAGNISGSVATIVSGVNVTQWQGSPPAPLVTALVQTQQSGNISGTVASIVSGVNVTQWLGSTPAPLVTALVQVQVSGLVSVTGNVTVGAYASGQSPAAQVWDTAAPIEATISPRAALRYIAAAEGGVTAAAVPGTFTIQAMSNAGTLRITAVTDGSGNRTSVALT